MPTMKGNPHSLIDTSSHPPPPPPRKIAFILTNSANPEQMSTYGVFLWVFTACQSTFLPVSRMIRQIQRIFYPPTKGYLRGTCTSQNIK